MGMGFSCLDVGGLLDADGNVYPGMEPQEPCPAVILPPAMENTVIEGIAEFIGVTLSNFLSDTGLQLQVRTDIAGAAAVQVGNVAIVSVRELEVVGRRLDGHDHGHGIEVDFEVVVPSTIAEEVAAQIEVVDFADTLLYASENGYGPVTVEVSDVAVVEDGGGSTSEPSSSEPSSSEKGYSEAELAIAAVFCLLGGAGLMYLLLYFTKDKTGYRQRQESDASNMEMEMGGMKIEAAHV